MSASQDTTIKVWNLNTGTVRRTLTGHTQFVYALKVLNNGILVSGSYDKTIKFWDLTDGTLITTLAQNEGVFSFELLENGDLACGLMDGSIKIYE